MDNPCISCSLSQNEKASCCGCPSRLEWERKKKKETIQSVKAETCKDMLNQLLTDTNPYGIDEYAYMYNQIKGIFRRIKGWLIGRPRKRKGGASHGVYILKNEVQDRILLHPVR